MKTIGIYCGSFNPFHIGHLNIVEKSESIFGKDNVIVAMGTNPDKVKIEEKSIYLASKELDANNLQKDIKRIVILYTGFLHTLIEDYESKGFNVVIVRGLRNGDDLDYEVNQFRFIDDFKKNVNVVYITCDKEFEHISSSAIRKIKEMGGSINKYIISES